MATQNITIPEGATWTQVTMEIMTNRSAYNIEYVIGTTTPDTSTLGHILKPNEGQAASELPTGNIYVRSVYKDAILIVD